MRTLIATGFLCLCALGCQSNSAPIAPPQAPEPKPYHEWLSCIEAGDVPELTMADIELVDMLNTKGQVVKAPKLNPTGRKRLANMWGHPAHYGIFDNLQGICRQFLFDVPMPHYFSCGENTCGGQP